MKRIAYQGEPGSNSDAACQIFTPDREAKPYPTFAHVFDALVDGEVEEAMVPVENAVAGRVDDIYRLLPEHPIGIVSEYFLPIKMHLMALPGADPKGLKYVRTHPMALGQCASAISRHGLLAEAARDTAGAARELKENPDMAVAVIAPEIAADHYGLQIVERDVQDIERNYTRFLRLTKDGAEEWPDLLSGPILTSMIFKVRNIPSALYKAMGGFATNGVNMIKLESYQEDANFTSTRFHAEIEGHPDDPSVRRALEELGYFTEYMKLLGVYPADAYRANHGF
ncbi:MAG: prephenate dehydratase [Pseudomonadota bacterium]